MYVCRFDFWLNFEIWQRSIKQTYELILCHTIYNQTLKHISITRTFRYIKNLSYQQQRNDSYVIITLFPRSRFIMIIILRCSLALITVIKYCRFIFSILNVSIVLKYYIFIQNNTDLAGIVSDQCK
jgi:hypothetical protein